jgi:site-specific recombinase XerD
MGNVAKHSDEITDEMWNSVNKFNRDMVQEFLENQTHLSKKTLIQYESGLKIYFNWVKENLNDKNCVEIKKKEYLKYQNYLTRRGLSESAIKFKKSCVSAFNNYIMFMYEEEYPTFRNYVTSEMRVVSTGYVHEKQPLTPDEYVKLCKVLEEKEDWQKLAYVMFSYSTGCRRAEARQLLKEITDYKPQKKIVKVLDDNGDEIEKESIAYKTHDIRCKGRSVVGKVRKLQFGEDVMFAIKKWLEVRGEDDCEYVFVTKKNNEYKQVSEITFNQWCTNTFSKIIGRRIHPHLFRESRATNLVVFEGKSLETAQKLLGHESSETTSKHYVIRDDEDDAFDAFV